MLKNIPKILSPELLSALCEMGHNDVIVLSDGNFPGAGIARGQGAKLIRADGHGVVELLDAILTVIPADAYVDAPFVLMKREPQDKDLEIPIWDEIRKVVEKHDPRGGDAMSFIGRFDFYDEAKKAYAIVQSGEKAIYSNVMIRKGVIS